MKQFSLVLFLITICSVSCKLFKTKSRIKNEQNPFHSSFNRQGSLDVTDVGSSFAASWICARNGTILKSSATSVRFILTNNIEGDCTNIDVDYQGMPWVVNKEGKVYRLKIIHGDSVQWEKVYSPTGAAKAIDIGCGQNNNTHCFIAVKGKNNPWFFDGSKFVQDKDFDAKSKILRLDVGAGKGGEEIVVVNEDGYVLQISRKGEPISLGMNAVDVSIGHDNELYVTNNHGIYYKSRCSKFFSHIHDIYAQRLSVGNSLWTIGLDNFVYNGTLHSYVDGC